MVDSFIDIDLEKLKLGDNQAYDALVNGYQKPLVSVVMRIISNYDESVEIVQDVFLSFYKNIDKFEGRSKVYTWLYRVATNRAIDLVRKREREKKYIKKIYIEASSDNDTFSDNTVQNIVLGQALSKLDENFRLPLLLLEFENYSYEDIASKLNIPVNTVKTRIFRGRKKLLSIMQKIGVTL